MIRHLIILSFILVIAARALAQETTATPAQEVSATPTPPFRINVQKRSWFSRILHPFSSSDTLPRYKNRKLNGLVADLQISPQPVRLSEVRQLDVELTITNLGRQMVTLDFPTDQRIEIYLLNAADTVLTKWSDNHAINQKPATVLINPGEHVEYKETIATRDLTAEKVFTAEVFLPQYPELLVRQKFMTEP
jgi:hypothetical protein